MTGPRPESALYNALNGNANARALKAQDAVTQQAPRAADAIRLGLDTGLDPDLVLSNYDTIKAEVARPGFNAERFAKESPVVAAWAAQKPSRTALLRDDAEPLGMLERLIGRWEMAPIGANIPGLGGVRVPVPMQTRRSLVQDEYAKGEAGIVAGRFGSRDRVGEIDLDDPTTRAEAERLLAAADAELPEATNLFERMVRGSANIAPSLINSLASGVEGGLAGASTGAALAVVAGNAGPQALVPEEILTAPAAAATGYLVGSRAGSFLASQEIEGGLANLRFRLMRDANGEPMDKTLARAASTSYGLAAGVLDVVSLGTLVKPFEKAVAARLTREAVAQALTVPTTRAALVAGTKDWLKAVGSETITETAQQGVQLWTEQMAVGASNLVDGTDFDTVEFARVRDELAETFTQTLVSMALLGVPGGATTTFGQLAQVRQATQDQQFLKALGDGVAAVSFRENLPETLREVAEAITVDGAVRDLSIPVERFNVYWQEQGIDPAEVAAQVGLTEQYQQAMALASADLVIPMPLYIEKLAGTKHHAGLTPDLRLRPGALTAREAQALAKQAKLVTPEQQAEAKAIVEAARPDESSQRVFETTRAALVATGRYTEEQAVENARIDQAFFSRLAPVFGTDAFSLYESRRGGVVGPQVAEPLFDAIKTLQRLEREKADPARVAEAMQDVERLTQMARTGTMLEQPAYHGTPHIFDRFSLDKIGTGEGAQAYGYGLYFAENEGIAEGYRKALSTPRHLQADLNNAMDGFNYFGQDSFLDAVAYLRANPEWERTWNADGEANELAEVIRSFLSDPPQGALYRVDISDAAVATFLDWDKPLSEQAPEVRDALFDASRNQGTYGDEVVGNLLEDESDPTHPNAGSATTGRHIYEILTDELGGQEKASKYLLRAGIRGIKYLDAGSRGTMRWIVTFADGTSERYDSEKIANKAADVAEQNGNPRPTVSEGTRNLVVFDENDVTITHRNGEPVTAAERADILEQNDGAMERPSPFTPEQEAEYAEATAKRDVKEARRILHSVLNVTAKDWGTQDYQGAHSPAGPGSGAPAFDLTEIYPDDVYSSNGLRYYGVGDERLDRAAYAVIQALRDKPNATVKIYRSVPKDSPQKSINPGDWVTTVRKYAVDHGEGTLLGEYRVISKEVTAKDIYTSGDSWAEWGYHPQERMPRAIDYTGPAGARTPLSLSQMVTRYGVTEMADGAVLEQNDGQRPNAFILPGTGKDLIALMRTANASSFLHEMSHEYLEVLADAAARDTAPAWVKQDWATTLAFLGVTDRSEITTAQHEKWARTWEGWLASGTAPSEALFGAFARFKVWFRGVYKAGVDLLKGQVNPDIAGVFSRLLASEEQIAAAEQASASPPLFESAEQAQATPAEFAALQVAQEEVRQRADASLTARLLAEQRRASLKWWHDERDRTRTEIEQEVNAEPDQQAAHFLRTGELLDGSPLPEGVEPMKLDRALLTARYGADVVKSLPRGVFAGKGTTGADPDVVAALFGIASGDRLVADLQALEPRTKRIERRTDEAMNQQYPDLLKDSAALAQAAQDAYHESDAAAEAMVAELRLLGRRSGAPVTDAVPALRSQVADDIRGLPLNRVEPHRFQQAEAKAGRLAYEAARAQDFAKAQFWKRKQLLNHLYYGEARKAVERADNIARYAGKFERPGIRARLGKSGQMYLDQIDNLMEQYEFRRVGEKALAKRESLLSWVNAQTAAGQLVQIDERVLSQAAKVNYRQLSLDELEAVADAMAQVDHLSRTKTKLLASLKQRTFEETVEDVVATIGSHHAITADAFDYAPDTFLRKAVEGIKSFDAKHVRPEFLFRWLDGDQETGIVQETFFAPLVEAENAEQRMFRAAAAKLEEIMSKVGTPKERAKWFSERIIVPGIPQSPFTKSNILSLALNWGNEDNRTAIRDGHKWTDQQVASILKTLTAADWAMVQELWDLIDSYWPEIAELQREMTGIVPAKVERVKFTVRSADGQDVQMNGGYYPLKYDSKRSFLAFSREQKANVKELFGTNNISPQTKKGHTIERVGSGGQVVSLDLGVLTGHIQNVVHDLTHRRALLDVDRLLNDKDVRAAIEGTAGKAAYKQLDPWLVNIASDRRDPAGAGERLVARARTGATVVNMGWKVTTAIVQPLGYLQTIELIGAKWTMRGVTATMGTPAEMKRTIEMILDKSEAMRNRQQSFDREVRDLYKKMAAKGPVSDVQQSFFYFTGLMDMVVAMPTWYGAYLKSMETMAPGDEAAAVAYADAMVRQSQGSGSAKDLAQVQQGSEYHRMFTMFYSYFSVLYNLMRRSVDRNVVNAETRNLPKFAASMALLWFAPAVLSELIAARGPGDDEDPLEWAAWKLAKYPLSSIVFVRDIVNAQGPDAYDYELSPVVAAGKTLAGTLNTAREVAVAAVTDDEVEITRADLKEAAMTAGYWGKLPARQMWITGEYLLRWMTGEEVPGSVPEAVKGVMFAPSR